MYRPEIETAAPETIRDAQLARLNSLLSLDPASQPVLRAAPRDGSPPCLVAGVSTASVHDEGRSRRRPGAVAAARYGRHLFSGEYTAYHQTSGTSGRPLVVLDTPESWEWWAECWQYVYASAGVHPRDRIFFALLVRPFHRLLERPRAAPGGSVRRRFRAAASTRRGAYNS